MPQRKIPTCSSSRLLSGSCLSVLLLLLAFLVTGTSAFSPAAFAPASRHPPLPSSSSAVGPLLYVSTTEETSVQGSNRLPPLGDDGIYHIQNKDDHSVLMQTHSDSIVVLKCFAPWCRACKGLEPKFLQVAHDPAYADLPVVQFADLSIQHNKAFVQSIGVLALPTIQFYVGGVLTDTFPCGPSKVPILKRKLAALVADVVDPETKTLRPDRVQALTTAAAEEAVGKETKASSSSTTSTTESSPKRKFGAPRQSSAAQAAEAIIMTHQEREQLCSVPYMKELSLADCDAVVSKAKKLTFEPGEVLMREGLAGRTFYVLQQGEVEIYQSTGPLSDPMVAGNYLGSVINRLDTVGDYFGERALITGEPRAASIRASEAGPVTCWAMDKDDFPGSSVLSGSSAHILTDRRVLDSVNEKYGVELNGWAADAVRIQELSKASQVRGSVNTPQVIRGVDTDDDDLLYDDATGAATNDNAEPAYFSWPSSAQKGVPSLTVEGESAFTLLTRFQMIRHVSKCFEYMKETKVAFWGSQGIRQRRSILVARLTLAQRQEYTDTFDLIDTSNDGRIELLELKRVMSSIGDPKSDEELLGVLNYRYGMDGYQTMNLQDFLGLMAEAHFYHLFRDIFASLDEQESGFVRARDLNRVLCGVRNLISDERTSIIEQDDQDMLIDYEQFSRMLLGTTLL